MYICSAMSTMHAKKSKGASSPSEIKDANCSFPKLEDMNSDPKMDKCIFNNQMP